MDFTETRIESEEKYKGIVVDVRLDTVRLLDGKKSKREVVNHPGGVAVLPIDECGYVYCVRQYRYAFGEHLIEIPAGKLEKGEDPAECAVRELSEEVGAAARELIPLGKIFPSPGFCYEILYLYLAKKLSFHEAHPDEGEFVSVEKIHIDTLCEMIKTGEICDAKTVAAALMAKQVLKEA